jgi:hypothetical protein
MNEADVVRRVEMLEETVESLRRRLPEDMKALNRRVTGVELQILLLRTEMREEFSAVRSEMATKSETATKKDLADLREELREDIAATARESVALHLESQRQSRMMFEELRSMLRVLGDRNPGPAA